MAALRMQLITFAASQTALCMSRELAALGAPKAGLSNAGMILALVSEDALRKIDPVQR